MPRKTAPKLRALTSASWGDECILFLLPEKAGQNYIDHEIGPLCGFRFDRFGGAEVPWQFGLGKLNRTGKLMKAVITGPATRRFYHQDVTGMCNLCWVDPRSGVILDPDRKTRYFIRLLQTPYLLTGRLLHKLRR